MGVSSRRAPRKVGRGGEGEAKSEGWSGESGGSNTTLDAEIEKDEGGYSPLTASPWGMQESGERGQWGDARAGRRDSGKGTSATADRGETRGRHGAWRVQGGKKGGRPGWEGAEP